MPVPIFIPALGILNDPPTSPNIGDCYIIGTAPTGAWVGKKNQIVYYGQEFFFTIASAVGSMSTVPPPTDWNFLIPDNYTYVWCLDVSVMRYMKLDASNQWTTIFLV